MDRDGNEHRNRGQLTNHTFFCTRCGTSRSRRAIRFTQQTLRIYEQSCSWCRPSHAAGTGHIAARENGAGAGTNGAATNGVAAKERLLMINLIVVTFFIIAVMLRAILSVWQLVCLLVVLVYSIYF